MVAIDIDIAQQGVAFTEICEDCKAWNAGKVALMKAAHEAERENADSDQLLWAAQPKSRAGQNARESAGWRSKNGRNGLGQRRD